MKVVHICTNIMQGGAARAAANLHVGLRRLGIESFVLSAVGSDKVPGCHEFPGSAAFRDALEEITLKLVWAKRTDISNSHFSIDLYGDDISSHPLIREADVLNLHWVAEFLSSVSIAKLAALGKPIVWTLHDMRPLTGGCHFSAGCDRFESGCGECPQLEEEPTDFTAKNIKAMAAAVALAKPVFVAPGRRMLQNAGKSMVSREQPGLCIPYGVDSALFRPLERSSCRAALQLESDAWYIMFATHGFRERRKGVAEALAVLDDIRRHPVMSSAVATGRMRILCCGEDADRFAPEGWQVTRVGFVEAEKMPLFYNSGNVLLFTSLEDNLPNVVMEAMACGTPIISHRVGGMIDLLDGETMVGRLFDIGDIPAAVGAVEALFGNDSDLSARQIGEKISQTYSLENQASEYLRLYESLAAQPREASPAEPPELIEGSEEAIPHAIAEMKKYREDLYVNIRQLNGHIDKYKEWLREAREDLLIERKRRVMDRMKDLASYHTGRWRFQIHRFFYELALAVNPLTWLQKSQWMILGQYFHYPPRELRREQFPARTLPDDRLPSMAIVTPSYNQAQYLQRTMDSVLNSGYPRLSYAVVDGASKDDSAGLIERYRDRLTFAVSEPDRGQTDAIIKGFRHVDGEIMAYLNSDDALMPGTLQFVGEYFARHPKVDVIYGNRVIIDELDREVGRWILPHHSNESTKRFDFIPQETMFWRKSIFEAVGGLDGSFRFAMDWDLILRFMRAGARFRRLPYFLGCFRAHEAQKSQSIIGTVGKAECEKLMKRELGEDESLWNVSKYHERYCRKAALYALLMERGIRW